VPLTPGSTFERYEIQSLIGRGGMGEVYRAIDTRLHRPVALKVLRTDKDASATVTEAGGVARRAACTARAPSHRRMSMRCARPDAHGPTRARLQPPLGARGSSS
jgi:serine/threonine protein kinase